MALFGLLRRPRHERTGFLLYNQAVAAARAPILYSELGVPDTFDGRFDMVSLYAFLLIRRANTLPPPGSKLAQAVFDAMFSDMDVTLREMGVGDLGVGRRVKLMWEGFHGRSAAYQSALESGDRTNLIEVLARNVWRDPMARAPAGRLADEVLAQDAHLAAQPGAAFLAGAASFLAADQRAVA